MLKVNMDNQNFSPPTNNNQPVVSPAFSSTPNKRRSFTSKLLFIIIALILVGGAGAGAWFVQQSKIDSLENENKELEQKVRNYESIVAGSENLGDVAEEDADTEREIEIKAIHGQLEAYYAQNGNYPTLKNMNDKNWLSENIFGLDADALKDPKGTSATLATKPAKNVYSYEVSTLTNASCENDSKLCAKYTLTATLDSGKVYEKRSLN